MRLVALQNEQKDMDKKDNKIYYFFDVLCGWCYGFSPVIQEIYHKYNNDFDFKIISGGMITGERIGPIGEVAGYIKQAYLQVEEASGVKFGKGFLEGVLEEGSTIFTSVTPSKALTTFKQHQPEKAIDFAAVLQKAVYSDGIEVSDPAAYGSYVTDFGLEEKAFVEEMESEEIEQITLQEFNMTNQAGVQGFPTLLASIDDEIFLLARGFAPLPKLEDAFQKLRDYAAAKAG